MIPTDNRRIGARGGIFLWGGLGLGLALVAALLSRGFGLLGAQRTIAGDAPALVHQGPRIIVPAGSPLRSRLLVKPASSEAISTKLVLPGVVEVDPARSAAVLAPLGGRVVELKVALGDRVAEGQVLALLDSPDLAQCFADDEFEKRLTELTANILANSAYASRVIKHALIESDELTLRDAHALELFKNEGVAPDSPQRVAGFFRAGRASRPSS